MQLWCNGVQSFEGPVRGWYDPGRGPDDGFGRVLPDLFETELNIKAGDNTLVLRLEVNESHPLQQLKNKG